MDGFAGWMDDWIVYLTSIILYRIYTRFFLSSTVMCECISFLAAQSDALIIICLMFIENIKKQQQL